MKCVSLSAIVAACTAATAAPNVTVTWHGTVYPYNNSANIELSPPYNLNLDSVQFPDLTGDFDQWGDPIPDGQPDSLPVQATLIIVTAYSDIPLANLSRPTYVPSTVSYTVNGFTQWTGGLSTSGEATLSTNIQGQVSNLSTENINSLIAGSLSGTVTSSGNSGGNMNVVVGPSNGSIVTNGRNVVLTVNNTGGGTSFINVIANNSAMITRVRSLNGPIEARLTTDTGSLDLFEVILNENAQPGDQALAYNPVFNIGGDIVNINAQDGFVSQDGGLGFHASSRSRIESRDGFIRTVTSGGDITADLISALAIEDVDAVGDLESFDPNEPGGTVPAVVAAPIIEDVAIDGTMFANVNADTITTRLQAGGAFGGTVTLADGLPENASIIIGGTFANGSVITANYDSIEPVDENDVGLAGQIIINEQYGGGSWPIGAHVVIDVDGESGVGASDILLTDPLYYDDSDPFGAAYNLGGGAAGLVSFAFNPYETVEANDGPLSQGSGGQAPQSVDLLHYGPVADASTGGALPVTVEKKKQYAAFGDPYYDWVDVSDEFVASVEGRVLTISADTGQPGFECPYDYRITQDAGRLICAGTTELEAQALDVQSFTYIFGVYCKADLSMNGTIDTPDPVLWTQNPVDVNDDGFVDVADLGDILSGMSE